MADNPLSSLIQLCLLIFVIWSILAGMYVVINHKLVASQHKENMELREENRMLHVRLAMYEQPVPDWVRQLEWRLFDDAPSDPRMGALN